MNCSYFAIEWRRTFKVNKNKYKKQNKKSINKHTKQNENIQTSERRIHYTRSMKYSKKFFLDSKIQQLKNSCHTSIESQKKSPISLFQVST